MALSKFIILLSAVSLMMTGACRTNNSDPLTDNNKLAKKILSDTTLLKVQQMATDLLKKGYQAGDGYPQVWIRDLNTFIEILCDVGDRKEIRKLLLVFFDLQRENGEILDGFALKEDSERRDIRAYPSGPEKSQVGFKNTVATDQETSLIQAVGKYIRKTGDTSILYERVHGKTVIDRMSFSINYLLQDRYSSKYGLIIGATTIDWGDVQPEDPWGVYVNEKTHWCCDIYDNAMLIIALETLIELSHTPAERSKWIVLKDQIAGNVRSYLWDSRHHKFIPHLYLKESPFPIDFDERDIHFHGGTAVAIEAGLLSKEEIKTVNLQMLDHVKKSGAPSIGLTIYPPYPKGYFKNLQNYNPYTYQNGGDWTWFGGRMVQQLVANGLVQEAYDEIRPMIDRVIINKGFYEWYDNTKFDLSLPRRIKWYGFSGRPQGSGDFRGSAGVLAKAIQMLTQWAKKESLVRVR
jgi:hypothetical protein